jgi:hypothetical protein
MILNHDVRERKLAKGDACMEMPSKLGYVAKITIAWYVLLVWFFLVLGASVSGWFHVPRGHPPCAGYLVHPSLREIVGTNYFSLQDPRRATCKEREMQEKSMVWPNI